MLGGNNEPQNTFNSDKAMVEGQNSFRIAKYKVSETERRKPSLLYFPKKT